MQNTKSYSPNMGVKVVAGLLVASQVTAIAEEANAQTVSTEVVETLEPTTVIATKFEKDLKDDVLMEESLVVKFVPIGETHTERVLREEGEYCRSTGRCGLSREHLSGYLLDF